MISDWIAGLLLVIGALFMLVAALGVLRFEDIYLRMHAATKAPSLGVLLMVGALILYFGGLWLTIEGVLIVLFIFITTPIGSHIIARTAHQMGIKQSKETHIDELPRDSEIKHPGKVNSKTIE